MNAHSFTQAQADGSADDGRPLLPRMTHALAQARNVLLQRARDWVVQVGDTPLVLSVLPQNISTVAQGTPWSEPGCRWTILRSQSCDYVLVVPRAVGASWLAQRFPNLKLPPLPDEFVDAALQAAMEQVSQTLVAMDLHPAEDQRTPPADLMDRDAALPALEVVLSHSGRVLLRAWLCTHSAGWEQLARNVAHHPQASNTVQMEHVPLRLRALVGITKFAVREIQTFNVGDVLLVSQPYVHQDGTLWLGQDRWGVRVLWQDSHFVVAETLTPLDTTMTTTEDDIDSEFDQEPLAMDDIPVRLTFDLGTCEMTLGQLRALQLGQSIDMGKPLSNAVSMRVNGALLGSGELIEIDGRIAVTITALNVQPPVQSVQDEH